MRGITLGRRTPRGFTLLEILVVLSVIALLAALLFPVLAQAREKARLSTCASQMRQLAMSVHQYGQDYDDTLPMVTNYGVPTNDPNRIWTSSVQPYVKSIQIFVCPSAPNARFARDWDGRGWLPVGYNSRTGYDPANTDEAPDSVVALSTLEETARIALFAETPAGDTAQKYRGYTFDPTKGAVNGSDIRLSTPLVADRDLVAGSSLTPGNLKPVFCRHFRDGFNSGTTQVVLADGHVKPYQASQILAQDKGANLIWRFR